MLKFSKGFGKRKSIPNTPDEPSPSPEPSFRVFDRQDRDRTVKAFDGGIKLARASVKGAVSPVSKEDNIFEELKGTRGSGASVSNTASTADTSSRLSASSTTPSSMDHSHEDKTMPPAAARPKSSHAFSLKARTFSFGRNKPVAASPEQLASEAPLPDIPHPLYAARADSMRSTESFQPGDDIARPRAVTTSSYASTATPPRLDDRDLDINMGGDFADMFSNVGKRKSQMYDNLQWKGTTPSPDYLTSMASRSAAQSRTTRLPPLTTGKTQPEDFPVNSAHSDRSGDLLFRQSSPSDAQRNQTHGTVLPPQDPQSLPSQRSGISSSGVKRRPILATGRQSTLDMDDGDRDGDHDLRESISIARRFNDNVTPRARDSWLPKLSETSVDGNRLDAFSTATRGAAGSVELDEESIFDSQLATSAVVAERLMTESPSRSNAPTKVMTPAQFEKYRQEQERLKDWGGRKEDENEDDKYDDYEDETEKQKQQAKQRRKQEAHMAVYRQQMMKVTGETTTRRPSLSTSQSAPNLASIGQDDENEEDEEVPLAILAAHGFPNKTRPPGRLSAMASNPNLRAASSLGPYPAPALTANGESAVSRGNLPVFARNLPQDPYGLVHSGVRESLAFGTGSMHGGPSRRGPPGGLVGVIATEERSRAMRRGSPNAAGGYPEPAMDAFGAQGMPMMPGMHGMPPTAMGFGTGMPGMAPMTMGDQAQLEMAQQMQQFMQMQMQFMQMMAGQGLQGQSPAGPSNRSSTMLDLPHPTGLGPQPRPASSHQPRPMSSYQRAMTTLDPNLAWQSPGQRNTIIGQPAPGYTPSIAPSERSNVGLPGRYRPVSQHAGGDSSSHAGSVTNAIPQPFSDGGNMAKGALPTIRPVPAEKRDDDDDDEEGWEMLRRRRENKRSIWRGKKDRNGLKEMAGIIN